MPVKLPASRETAAAVSWRLLGPPLQSRYQTILARLGWPGDETPAVLQTLGITSAGRGEGVSTVAAHLAAVAAASGREVLLVDAHFAAPIQHQRFGVPEAPGLADWLESGGDAPAAIPATAVRNLSVLPAGKATSQASRLHDVFELASGLKELSAGFDLVIFDLPPAGRVSAALRFASVLDGVLLVVEADRTPRDDVTRTAEMLERARATLLGTVFNKAADER